jgi:hypothetical protein
MNCHDAIDDAVGFKLRLLFCIIEERRDEKGNIDCVYNVRTIQWFYSQSQRDATG